MVDPWQKSKKRLSGSSGAPSRKRLPNLTFYLDENWDCPDVKDELHRAGIRYRIYKQDVPANVGTRDEAFLPKVGQRGWVLVTADWHQRYRPREIADLRLYKVRHFALPGNLGASAMAKLLVATKNDIRACCRDNEPPISASVMRQGGVRLLMDAKGNLHDRGEERVYHKGRLTTRVPYSGH
jgi:PIN like domain